MSAVFYLKGSISQKKCDIDFVHYVIKATKHYALCLFHNRSSQSSH